MAASSCHRVMQRASSTLKSAVKSNARTSFLNNRSAATSTFPIPSRSTSSSLRSFSHSRNVAALGCAQSLLPLHSAVAAARLTSCLSTKSRSCRALSQDGVDGT